MSGAVQARRRGVGRLVRLQRWLLGGSVLLVLVIAGLVGYARHRARRALLDLPRLLGADIKSETDGFTYSQTVKGRTLFTIHAARAIQHRDGKTTLRNVAVTLYGEPGTSRVDRIRGSEFEYDQAAGVVRAMGESEIDVAAPTANAGDDARRVHVLASGLVFDQKRGLATADGTIKFEYGAVKGTATGADFDAHTGLLVLRHDVHVTNVGGGERQRVDAASALLDRATRVAHLFEARVAQDGEMLLARELVVQLRPEDAPDGGSIEAVHGTGGVMVRTADGATAEAPLLEARLTGDNKLQKATLSGGVTLHAAQQDGHASVAVLTFDDAGHASSVHLDGDVDLLGTGVEQRQLTAHTVQADLATDAGGHVTLHDSIATGHAVLTIVSEAVGAKAPETTVLKADVLHAFGSSAGGQWQLQRVAGDGETRVEQSLATGETRTSTGDRLDVAFAAKQSPANAAAISSFIQQGRVHITDAKPASAADKRAPQESVADAQKAEYQASTGIVVLTGAPTARNAQLQLEATRIAVALATGDTEANGAVRGSALPGDAREGDPVHFTADRLVSNRMGRQATLFGVTRLARLWTATSQLEAPVIDMDQAKGTLFAHPSAGATPGLDVRAVLPGRSGGAGEPVRVLGAEARYTPAAAAIPAIVVFSGGVRMDSSSGQVTADRATATLQAGANRAGAMMAGGTVEQVVADGHVRVQQPGRTATGQHLVYTAASQQFVLTGGPPVVQSSVQGTVSGTSLLFRAGDDSVEVAGAAGQPVRTEVEAPTRQAARQPRPTKAAGTRK